MKAKNPISGAWDTHVHAGPDVSDRKHDIVELTRRAIDVEMGGLVLKNHHFPTAMAAGLTENVTESDISLVSTLVLNRSVGGLNLDAITGAAKMGAARVELPTMTAKHNMLEQGEPRTISLLDDNGNLRDICWSVLTESLNNGMVIGTGHISVEEVEAVVSAVVELDGQIIVTHPELHAARDGIGLSIEKQQQLSHSGVYFERCSIVTDPTIREHFLQEAPQAAHDAFAEGEMFDKIVEAITATGPEHNLLSTDYGQPSRSSPPEALGAFHADLEDAGISQENIVQMARENPENLFGGR